MADGSEGGNFSMQGKASGELQGVGKNINSDSSRPGSSSRVSFSTSRPSSNHNNRTQQGIGPQKGTKRNLSLGNSIIFLLRGIWSHLTETS